MAAGTIVTAGIRSPHAVAAAAGVVADVRAAHGVHVIAAAQLRPVATNSPV